MGHFGTRDGWRVAFLAAASFFAGGVNGLLGTGGGMILLFALGLCLPPKRQKEGFMLSSCGVFVFSAISAGYYQCAQAFPADDLPRFALPAACGGLLGAWLLRKAPTVWLRRLFALLLLYSGVRMLGVLPW